MDGQAEGAGLSRRTAAGISRTRWRQLRTGLSDSNGRLIAALVVILAVQLVMSADLRISTLVDSNWRNPAAVAGLVVIAGAVVLVGVLLGRYVRLGSTLADRDEELSATHAVSHDWLWQATADLVLTSCSSAVSDLLGYAPRELIGRSMFDFVVPEDLPRARAILGQAVASGRGWTDVELQWNHRDGHPVPMQGSATPVVNAAGTVIGFRGARRHVAGDAAERRRLAEILHRLDDVVAGELPIALQPIVDLASGQLCGAEALARFPDNRPPDVWFAEAHAVGRGIELELLALRCALECLPSLPEPVRLSVNASPALALDGRFRELLERHPVERVTVEITEHAAVALYDELRAALQPLRERGLALAVDDAGAGYASFAHVLQLRPDVIKLDRSWLQDIPDDAARRTLVTAIVLLALDLGAVVTAEGLERLDQVSAVTQLGVDHAQGYFFARPSTDPAAWERWRSMTWGSSRRWAELFAGG